jgi:hypothetical protein
MKPVRSYASGVAVDGQGNIAVSGGFYKNIQLGTRLVSVSADPSAAPDPTSSAVAPAARWRWRAYLNAEDSFVAKLSPYGEPIWARQFGRTSYLWNRIASMGMTVDGEIVFLCEVTPPLESAAETYFVERLASDGKTRWTHSLGSSNKQEGALQAQALVIDENSDTIVAGQYSGSLSPCRKLWPGKAEERHQLFVLKLDPIGSRRWAFCLDTKHDSGAAGLAALGGDRIGLIGYAVEKQELLWTTDELPYPCRCGRESGVKVRRSLLLWLGPSSDLCH